MCFFLSYFILLFPEQLNIREQLRVVNIFKKISCSIKQLYKLRNFLFSFFFFFKAFGISLYSFLDALHLSCCVL